MPQLHLYLDREKAAEVKRRATAEGLSVSKYLSNLVSSSLSDSWPDRYFETVIGGWCGEPLLPEDRQNYEPRDVFDLPS